MSVYLSITVCLNLNLNIFTDGNIYAEAFNNFLTTTLKNITIIISVRDVGGLTDTKNLLLNIIDNPKPPILKFNMDFIEIDELQVKISQ